MNNVYVSPNVVRLLTRLANVVSTFSISNHYFFRKSDKTNPEVSKTQSWSLTFADLRVSLHEASLTAKGLTLPWFNGKWSWPPILSYLETELQSSNNGPSPPPTIGGSGKKPKMRLQRPEPPDTVHLLLQNPTLYDPLRTPRYPVVLCHGLYGFDTRGPSSIPSMRMHYWANVLRILRDTLGAEVIVTSVPGTGSISSRSESMDRQLQIRARGRGVNFLAHSMGGLDCRHLISRIKPTDYVPLSLTTVSTPHRGSPFMDWCEEYLGLGKLGSKNSSMNQVTSQESEYPKSKGSFSVSLLSLPSSFRSLFLSLLDYPAYANLTSRYLNDEFNPATPDDPSVKYFSVAGRVSDVNVWHPLWLTKMVLDGFEEKERSRSPLWAQDGEWGNDGLVTIQSAKWGEFLGTLEECDHWQMRGARGIEFGVDLPNIPALSSDWSFRDWSRFTNFWNTDVKQSNRDVALSSVRSMTTEVNSSAAQMPCTPPSTAGDRARERERKLEQDDAVVKSSTDKLSAVMDWLIEQVPSTPKVALSSGEEVGIGDLGSNIGRLQNAADKESKVNKSELETKKDLERFYIALCRKIYDEGL
ncbi:Alpha/Beta hydrolase protein [Amanita rubescens]|nr:Alpha/Beta hydrolase protein [Amanita rubescens]